MIDREQTGPETKDRPPVGEAPTPLTEAPKRRGRPPGSKSAPKVEAPTDADLTRVRNAWIGLWAVIKFIAARLGFEEVPEEALTEERAMEDAAQLAPLVNSYPFIMRVLSFIGAPLVIFNRVSRAFRRKPKPVKVEPPAPQPPGPTGEGV